MDRWSQMCSGWLVDILGVDILRVNILGVDILRVDIQGVDILGGKNPVNLTP